MKAGTLANINFNDIKNLEYLQLLMESPTDISNIEQFALQVKKFAVKRDLYTRYQEGMKSLEGMTGEETLTEIISTAESDILQYIAGNASNDQLLNLSEEVDAHFKYIMGADIVDQIGINTGFPIWDNCIGGGLINTSVNVVGSRSGFGKSFLAMRQSVNITALNIPVLYLDSELDKETQLMRSVCMISKVPMYLYKTGKFRQDKEMVKAATEAVQLYKHLPIYYQSISGVSPVEVLSIIRRWILKHVGLQPNGHAKQCVVVYDYIKLVSSKGITNSMPEHIAFGFLMIDLHNLAHKYNIPIVAFCQLNRDGINSNDTDSVAGSDRILWNASSLSFLKDKGETDKEMQCGFEYGNKALRVVKARHGSGFENENDYINLKCSLKPNVSPNVACGDITEGFLYSQIVRR